MTDRAAAPLAAEAAGNAPGRGRLTGHRILVVGAGTRAMPGDPRPGAADPPPGNGRAIARLAGREGAAVVCADVDRSAAEQTAEAVRGEGGTAEVLVADATDPAACEFMVTESVAVLGGLDGLVANIGSGAGRRLSGTTTEDWDATFVLNTRAHFLLAKAALPVLATEGGSIVFVGSVAGLRPGSQIPAYDSSKAALSGLCRHVAAEGAATGVRANLLVPGLIDTPLGRVASQGRPSRATTGVPLGRQGTAWEVAYAAIFLLSGESSYVTGQQLVVDGGLTLR